MPDPPTSGTNGGTNGGSTGSMLAQGRTEAQFRQNLFEMGNSLDKLVAASGDSSQITYHAASFVGRVRETYALVKAEAQKHGDIISIGVPDHLDSAVKAIERNMKKRLDYEAQGKPKEASHRQAQVDYLVNWSRRRLRLLSDSMDAYRKLSADRRDIATISKAIFIKPQDLAYIREALYTQITKAHPDFQSTIFRLLVEDRKNLKLKEDHGRQDKDIWARIMADLKSKGGRRTYVFGSNKSLFEALNSTDFQQVERVANNAFVRIQSTATDLLQLYDQMTALAIDNNISPSVALDDKLTGPLNYIKTQEGAGMATRDAVATAVETEVSMLQHMERILNVAITGTSLKDRAEKDREEHRDYTPPPAPQQQISYASMMTHTLTGPGETRRFAETIAEIASQPEKAERAVKGRDFIDTVLGGVYKDIAELKGAAGAREVSIIPYPTLEDIGAVIRGIIEEPSYEAIAHACELGSRVFEAKEAYTLHRAITELYNIIPQRVGDQPPSAAAVEQAKAARKLKANEIKVTLAGINNRLGALEREINLVDAGDATPTQEIKFDYSIEQAHIDLDSIVEDPNPGKVQEFNGHIARMYEVLRLYKIMAESKRDLFALNEEVKQQQGILNFSYQQLIMHATLGLNSQPDLKALTRRELALQRRYAARQVQQAANPGQPLPPVSDDLTPEDEARLFDEAIADMKAQKGIFAYCARIYSAGITYYQQTLADRTCEAVCGIEEFGRQLLRLYGTASSVAKALEIDMDHSHARKLLEKYQETGRLGTAFDFAKSFTRHEPDPDNPEKTVPVEVLGLVELEDVFSTQSSVLSELKKVFQQLFEGMGEKKYDEYPIDSDLLAAARQLAGSTDTQNQMQAVDLYELFIDRDNAHGPASLEQAVLYEKMKDYVQAVPAYDLAIINNPNSAPAYAGRANCKYQTTDVEGAKADVAHALQLDPSYGAAVELAKKLGIPVPKTSRPKKKKAAKKKAIPGPTGPSPEQVDRARSAYITYALRSVLTDVVHHSKRRLPYDSNLGAGQLRRQLTATLASDISDIVGRGVDLSSPQFVDQLASRIVIAYPLKAGVDMGKYKAGDAAYVAQVIRDAVANHDPFKSAQTHDPTKIQAAMKTEVLRAFAAEILISHRDQITGMKYNPRVLAAKLGRVAYGLMAKGVDPSTAAFRSQLADYMIKNYSGANSAKPGINAVAAKLADTAVSRKLYRPKK